MDNKALSKIAARLATASEQEQKRARSAGEEFGRRWAAAYARPSELRRMENATDDTSSWSNLFDSYASIGSFVGGDVRDLPDAGPEFIEDEELEEAYCDGVVEGALAVWQAVQDLPAVDAGEAGSEEGART